MLRTHMHIQYHIVLVREQCEQLQQLLVIHICRTKLCGTSAAVSNL
jgi:hypothetical protein